MEERRCLLAAAGRQLPLWRRGNTRTRALDGLAVSAPSPQTRAVPSRSGFGIRRAAEAVAQDPQETAEEYGEPRDERDADTFREDVVATALDAAEEAVVDGDEDPESGTGAAIDEGKEREAGFVIVLGTFCEGLEELALVEGRARHLRGRRGGCW